MSITMIMYDLEKYSRLKMQSCENYRQKIAEHTPPKSENDARMIRLYQRYLIRDRSFLHNLELRRIQKAIHMEAVDSIPSRSLAMREPSASFDPGEFRAFLDESCQL